MGRWGARVLIASYAVGLLWYTESSCDTYAHLCSMRIHENKIMNLLKFLHMHSHEIRDYIRVTVLYFMI